ncbi:MAG: hypothetical protein HYZ28_05140 [Myxococcales bacterium]|nr:hypothetical protein [Myxococcales bacterium]
MAIALALFALAVGAVGVSVQPQFVVHGGSAQLEVQVSGDDGSPLPNPKVELTTTAGSLGPPEPTGPGRFVAAFHSPKERYPQVALVCAKVTAEGKTQLAWLALPVHGRDVLKLSTKAGATAVVSIPGKPLSEPRVADAKGKVEMPVEVPPGLSYGRVITTDKLGNRKEKPVDLEPPPFQRVAAASPAAFASWADPSPLPLEVYAVLPSGAPLGGPAAALSLSADVGAVGPLVPGKEKGVFRTTYRAPEKVGSGQATLRAALRGEPRAAELRLSLLPGPAGRIEIVPDAPAYVAGQPAPMRLEVRAFDEKGNGVAAVEARAEVGRLTELGGGAHGLNLPEAFGGKTAVKVFASSGGAKAELEIPLRPGPPASGSLAIEPALVRAGDEPATARVELLDRFGNPVSEARLVVTATSGRPGEVRSLGGGKYELSFSAEAEASPGAHRLEVRSSEGPVELSVPVGVLHHLRSWSLSAGGMAGALGNFKDVWGAGPAAQVSLRAAKSQFELFAEAGGTFYSPALASPDHPDLRSSGTQLTVRYSGASASLGFRYFRPLSALGELHGSASAGWQWVFPALSLEEAAAVTNATSSGPTARLATGYALRVGPGRLLAELRLLSAWVRADPRRGGLNGNLGGVGFAAGYLLELR